MASLVFTNDPASYQQQQQQQQSTTTTLKTTLSEGPTTTTSYYGNNHNLESVALDDDDEQNNHYSSSNDPIYGLRASSSSMNGIRIGKYICCPSSSSFMSLISVLIFALWIIPYMLIIALLIVCGIDTKVTTAISYCGTHQHHLRPMFVATFCINGVLFSIVFVIRALVLYVKWFGWRETNNNYNTSRWRRLLTCQFSNIKFPGRREFLSIPFWLIIVQLIPGVSANILLIIMAIYPDEKATRTVHFVTAFLGLLFLIIYTGFSFIIQAWRLFRACRGKTQPFHFIRHVNSLTINKRKMYILSVSGFSISMIYHFSCMIGAIICIPIYLTKFIPIAEWIAVLLILLGMVPLMFDNMLSIREGPATLDENPQALLR